MARKADYYGPPSDLTEEQVAALWAVFTAATEEDPRRQEIRDQLIEYYMPLVYQTAERMAGRLPSFIDVNDLIGSGMLGLIDAISKFEPERGNLFSTYCSMRVSGAIIDELRRQDWAPRLVRSRASQLERAREELEATLGRTANDDELAAEMNLSMEQFESLKRETQVKSMVSLDRKWDESDDHELGQIEMLPDPSVADPLSEMERAEIREVALRGLSEKEKMVVQMYYFDNLSLKEIGMILDLSESRVCQIHAQVLDFLQDKFKHRKITYVNG